jgi:hypothetical protein
MKKMATVKKASSNTLSSKAEEKKTALAPSTTSKVAQVAKPKTPKKTSTKETSIESVCEAALAKLKELNIDEGLQSEIQWCLGSYHYDQNPAGLYQMAKRALAIFTVEKANKAKGISTKLVTDLEKAIGTN